MQKFEITKLNGKSVVLSQHTHIALSIIHIGLSTVVDDHILVSVFNSLPQFSAVIKAFIVFSSMIFESVHAIGDPGINVLLNLLVCEFSEPLEIKDSMELLSSIELVRDFSIFVLATRRHLHLWVLANINMQELKRSIILRIGSGEGIPLISKSLISLVELLRNFGIIKKVDNMVSFSQIHLQMWVTGFSSHFFNLGTLSGTK